MLREYFDSLDDDESGQIGVDELEDPLIALGLVDNRQQVQRIVSAVDEDQSEQIEFVEFLKIIKGGNKNKGGSMDDSTKAIYEFFKELTSGKLKIEGNKNVPFSLFVSAHRRRMIIDSIRSNDPVLKKNGEKILNNYKKQKAEKNAREILDAANVQSRPMSDAGMSRRSGKTAMGATTSSIKTSKSSKQREREAEF